MGRLTWRYLFRLSSRDGLEPELKSRALGIPHTLHILFIRPSTQLHLPGLGLIRFILMESIKWVRQSLR